MEQGREPSSPSAPWFGATEACTRQAPRASAAPRPLFRGLQGCFRGVERRRPFRPLLLFFFPPSYTHRPWFTRPAAPARSWAGVRKPTNDFVCVLVEIDSRPPNPSPGSHMPRGLGRVGDFDPPCSRPPVLDFSGASPGRSWGPTGAVAVSLQWVGAVVPACGGRIHRGPAYPIVDLPYKGPTL
jgi:hypothetical protein